MMGKAVVVTLFLVALCLSCTQQPTCAPPYMTLGQTCCLDKDASGVCDAEEGIVQGTSADTTNCDICPPRFVTQKEEIVVYKYVCPDGSIIDTKDGCGIVQSDADLFTLNTTHNDSLITIFDARPACRGNFPSAELHVTLTQSPSRIEIQARTDPQGDFATLVGYDGSATVFDDEFFYIGLCSKESCGILTDTQLPLDGASAVRLKLDFAQRSEYSKELLIDPTPASEYGKKTC
jgi:hypothetical protein